SYEDSEKLMERLRNSRQTQSDKGYLLVQKREK
ncbi:MAG: hypothetical protein ACI9YE_002131, partial [Psychroserpens sp.]